ncbi:uncharacterized protein M421DRAFT_418324 [Didymella exigua CBS 183.55]|uniref:Uncharacterized protein n=1 Tax=Didymella exigua CBS 183.55 TaxID=1150837 RepID=A0A6A5RU04_9PLEO|nr:uncharacterized protein M421DRAFT_418324 [Didymella exigua CBS 183.55]KAF1930850.1 hypothetical protein M421DRAFT_418324 [Didymella exigua CBS 183.55]
MSTEMKAVAVMFVYTHRVLYAFTFGHTISLWMMFTPPFVHPIHLHRDGSCHATLHLLSSSQSLRSPDQCDEGHCKYARDTMAARRSTA